MAQREAPIARPVKALARRAWHDGGRSLFDERHTKTGVSGGGAGKDKFPDAASRKATAEHAQLMVGFAPERCDEPPSIESIELRASRVSAPSVFAALS